MSMRTVGSAWVVSVLAGAVLAASCGGGDDPEGDGTGGSSTGGAANAGASTGGGDSGGAGAATTGGAPSGGAEPGGAGGQGGVNAPGGAGGEGGTVPTLPISVHGFGDEYVPPGGDYLETTANGIALYSFYRGTLAIRNDSASDVTITSVEFVPEAGLMAEEWTLIDPDSTDPQPLALSDVTLGAGEATEFDIYFYPVEWGMRSGEVTITYDGGETYSFTISGRARDNGVFTPASTTNWERIFGDPAQDIYTGGAAIDAGGNVYLSGNVDQWFTDRDLVAARVNDDGTLGWAKVWNEAWTQNAPDPGQNNESGGSADSLAYSSEGGNGYVYLVGRRSLGASNSFFHVLVVKVDAATGAVVWANGWYPTNKTTGYIASDSSQGYAIDAAMADRVLVTGVTAGEANVAVIALDKTDGSLIFQKQIDVAAGYNDRGYSVRTDGTSAGYVAGLTNGRGMLLRLTGLDAADGTGVAIAWAKEVNMGTGSNVNSLDLDAAGNAYLSLDRRGATTQLSVARIDTDGTQAWGKTFDDANTGDNNNTYVVRVAGSSVYVGGRVAMTPFDTQWGEGFLMRLAAADGAYDWGSLYYTGKGAEEMAEGRVKGILFDGATGLKVVMQSWTSTLNFEHYWGYWYQATDDGMLDPPACGDGAGRLADYALTLTDRTPTMTDVAAGEVRAIDTTAIWVDPPATVALDPLRDATGNGSDGDVVVFDLTLP